MVNPNTFWTFCLTLAALLLAAPGTGAAPPLLPPQPVVRQLVLTGSVDAGLRERTERHLRQALDGGANVLILELACAGGDAAAAHDLASDLLRLTDRPGLLTIAFVTPKARDTACLIALACDQIALQSTAHLGDWEPYLREHPQQQQEIANWLMQVAEARGRPALLARALVDHDLHVRLVRSGSTLVFEPGDASDPADQVKPQSRKDLLAFLTLDAQEASRYGVADKVESQTALYRWLGVDEAAVVVVQDDRFDRLGAFLRDYRTRLLLIVLGLASLLLECRFPRALVPAVVAALCFVLLFWSHSQLNPQETAYALVLFGLGVVMLGLEVSFRPGWVAFGAGGGVMLCISLGLLIYGRHASGSAGWGEVGRAVGQVATGVVLASGLTFLLTRYLPRVPAGARLLPSSGTQPALPEKPAASSLDPDRNKEEAEEGGQEQWLGAIGATATPMEPSGMVRIGDAFVPALCDEGAGLGSGVRVQVVGFRDGRVVVQAV